jgi:catechol 2,3-dioxygenase-like lactoylglutathione lyase family enzyme
MTRDRYVGQGHALPIEARQNGALCSYEARPLGSAFRHCVAGFFLITALLSAADLTIDHVSVSGTDLQQMQARLAAVGIPSEFGGPHSNGATQMAIASFPDGSYLELIAPQANPDQKALAAHYWSKQMLGNAGPTAWAVRASDLAAEAGRLRSAGIAVTSPSRSGRKRPDGTVLDWETAQVGAEPNGTFFPFLIHDFTPRNARAFPKGQPSAKDFAGVKLVVIAVRDLKASTARYRQAFGLPAPAEEQDSRFGARLAAFAGTPVVLASPVIPRSWLAERIERFGEGPCAFVLGSAAIFPSAASKSRWFGAEVSWFDPEKLGWRLGVEK